MKKTICLFAFLFCFGSIQAQEFQQIINDSVSIQNGTEEVIVATTTIRQFYEDSTCIWEIKFPQLVTTSNPEGTEAINKVFERLVSFGDCDNGSCLESDEEMFPRFGQYWNKVEVASLDAEWISYVVKEGGCPIGTKSCFGTTDYFLYSMKTHQAITPFQVFKTDRESLSNLEALIHEKLGFRPANDEVITNYMQIFMKDGNVALYYDNWTIADNVPYTIVFELQEIKSLLKKEHPLQAYFSSKKEG
jgi:hypothetical protein